MILVGAMVAGFLWDLLAGDPAWLPHPVVGMGKLISFLEKKLRRLFPVTAAGERAAGCLLVVLVLGVVAGVSVGCLWAVRRFIWVWAALQAFFCGQCLAAKGLWQESSRVQQALAAGDLPAARKAVARIVGRDTEALSAQGVARAAVETVAENTSDGVVAPLFWFMLAGAPGALCYKAVNTMDSMVGYRNDRYRYFGTAAARLDDLANLLPARLAALCMVAAAPVVGLSGKGAFRIFCRDRYCHKSPNSAQTESACAGALGVRLAGSASYFGKLVEKPYIGDDTRPIEPEDIHRANRLMVVSSMLSCLLFCGLRAAVVLFLA
ncbi:MAG: adenosylcobinamide-phosphate synthase CbiB [Pygmaiobacter massiliensis]|nr:adenosylcobinamide-phosphate synthase CbiB [Pygmaiobacter massiliensis]